jgi:hypothetical protein
MTTAHIWIRGLFAWLSLLTVAAIPIAAMADETCN